MHVHAARDACPAARLLPTVVTRMKRSAPGDVVGKEDAPDEGQRPMLDVDADAQFVHHTFQDAPPMDEDAARPSKGPRPAPLTGEVSEWKAGQGWGFIRRDDLGPNVFVHYSGLAHGMRALTLGDLVQFELQAARESGRPDLAVGVRVLVPASARVQAAGAAVAACAAGTDATPRAATAFVPRSVATRGRSSAAPGGSAGPRRRPLTDDTGVLGRSW